MRRTTAACRLRSRVRRSHACLSLAALRDGRVPERRLADPGPAREDERPRPALGREEVRQRRQLGLASDDLRPHPHNSLPLAAPIDDKRPRALPTVRSLRSSRLRRLRRSYVRLRARSRVGGRRGGRRARRSARVRRHCHFGKRICSWVALDWANKLANETQNPANHHVHVVLENVVGVTPLLRGSNPSLRSPNSELIRAVALKPR